VKVLLDAILVLSDGTVFEGKSIGALGHSEGEIVFNTSMTGYQEILTDPSYAEQIITLTYPHIGNVGCTEEDEEATSLFSKGLVIRDLPKTHSNFRAQSSLSEYLARRNVIGIADIDTRALTRRLRQHGAQSACIMAGENLSSDEALKLANAFRGLNGLDLAKEVTTSKPYDWNQSTWSLGGGSREVDANSANYNVVAYDFGIKHNILRLLADRGCKLTVVPAKTSFEEVMALKPDGVFLSNGPGDPEPCDYAISAISSLLEVNVPLFGICLGHQLLSIASGAKTFKMKTGHHGANHPVKEHASSRVFITSQNHGFAVDEASLPANLEITHTSLFDNTIQGVRRVDKPAFSFQGHPEASPGPQDILGLFDQFVSMMSEHMETKNA
jgi:carbamoyl-phosphate synthase small subunit